MMDPLLIDGPADARCHLILAHGAGQGGDSPFMNAVAHALAAAGLRVVRFSFPYMVRSEIEGRRRPPDRTERFLTAAERFRCDPFSTD